MTIFIVRIRFITYQAPLNNLFDKTRQYIVKADNRNDVENKIDRLIKSYKLSTKSIVQVLSIRYALLDNNDIGEIT